MCHVGVRWGGSCRVGWVGHVEVGLGEVCHVGVGWGGWVM